MLKTILTVIVSGFLFLSFSQSTSNVEEAVRYSSAFSTSSLTSSNAVINSNISAIESRSSSQLNQLGTRWGWGDSNVQLNQLGTRWGWGD